MVFDPPIGTEGERIMVEKIVLTLDQAYELELALKRARSISEASNRPSEIIPVGTGMLTAAFYDGEVEISDGSGVLEATFVVAPT